MFEAIKLGRKVDKESFNAQQEALRTELLLVQRELRQTDIPVIILIAGVEGAGKGEVVNRLHEWLDARGLQSFAYWDETDEERQRPRYWRFWRSLPPRGEMAILFGGWYLAPLEHRVHNLCNDAELDGELNRIVDFERMLIQDGALVVKFWFHLAEADQDARLRELKRDDRSRWKMTPQKGKQKEHYAHFEYVAERMIRHTDRGTSPWYLIEAGDRRYRDLTMGKTLLQAIKQRLSEPPPIEPPHTAGQLELPDSPEARVTVLDHLDLAQKLAQDIYRSELTRLQQELNGLCWDAYNRRRSLVIVFEGADAGGKGGAIRRFTTAIDARLYRAIPIAAPTDEENAHHYLWRFWRHIPRAGYITIFDRSWYGRVLVERIEGFATEAEWRRAYDEINQFEEQLVESGVILCKFWLQVSDEEQLRRFKDREAVPYKQYKITAEDWRNRDKAPQYRIAVNDMVVYTSTESASWTLVEADDKPFARIKVLTTLRDALRDALKDGSFADPGGYLPCGKRPGNGSEAKGKTATGKPANGKGQKGSTGDDSPEPTPTPPDSNGGGQAAKAKPGKKKSRSKG
ncbi:MAG: polyphosphate:AMP phosphotransferase [Gammaproteobacteria bacterium]|nr:polyphosphate:AMP phosphotransferase [Gammaproteobacteria bacterium]